MCNLSFLSHLYSHHKNNMAMKLNRQSFHIVTAICVILTYVVYNQGYQKLVEKYSTILVAEKYNTRKNAVSGLSDHDDVLSIQWPSSSSPPAVKKSQWSSSPPAAKKKKACTGKPRERRELASFGSSSTDDQWEEMGECIAEREKALSGIFGMHISKSGGE